MIFIDIKLESPGTGVSGPLQQQQQILCDHRRTFLQLFDELHDILPVTSHSNVLEQSGSRNNSQLLTSL